MICRNIIRQQQSDDEADPYLEISWYDRHPGDMVEQSILQFIYSNQNESFYKIINENGNIIGIKWWSNLNIGVSVVLNSIEDNILKINYDAYEWSLYLKSYIDYQPQNWDDLLRVYSASLADKIVDKIPTNIKKEWFNTSLFGGDIILSINEDIHNSLGNIFGFFPWSIYFIHDGDCTSKQLKLNFVFSEQKSERLDEIFEKISGDLDEDFWMLIYRFIIDLLHVSKSDRILSLISYLEAITSLTKENLPPQKKISTLNEFSEVLPNLNVEFLNSYIQSTLFELSSENTSAEVCNGLLEFSNSLIEMEFSDLAKLAEATALEMSLKLVSIKDRENIILELVKRSKKWGNIHLIAFVDSLTGLFSDTKSGKNLLDKVVQLVNDDLEQTWDGLISLVETQLISGNIKHAIELRYRATQTILEKSARRDDVFNALVWALQYDIEESILFEISKELIKFAIISSDDENTLGSQLDVITQRAVHNNRPIFLTSVFRMINEIALELPNLHYQLVFERLIPLIKGRPNYFRPYIELQVTKLLVMIFQSKLVQRPILPDEYFQLVSSIYNEIDPSSAQSKELLVYVTRKIIYAAVEISDWSIIQEAQKRFSLLFGQEASQLIRKEIYFQAALQRTTKSSNELKENDIGIRLFNEALEMSDIVEERDYLAKVIPKIKELAIKSRSYNSLTNIIILDVKLKKLTGENWISKMISDIKMLLSKGKIIDANLIFNEALQLDLTKEEHLEILSIQLEMAEHETDLLSAEEIYFKRLHLITLSDEDSADHEYILKNYRAGISELISKGDTQNLNNLLLDALDYNFEHKLETLQEFQQILFDSFSNLLADYENSRSDEDYARALLLFRTSILRFSNINLDLLSELAILLIKSNLSLHQKDAKHAFLRRSNLAFKELSLIIHNSSLTISEDIVGKLFEEYLDLIEKITNENPLFGLVEITSNASIFLKRIERKTEILPLLDTVIDQFHKEMIGDSDCYSIIILLLFLLSEVYLNLEADFDEKLISELVKRMNKVLNFSLTLSLTSEIKTILQKMLHQSQESPQALFQEIPFSIGQYLNAFDSHV